MGFKSRPGVGSQDEGCHYASTETVAVWPRTSMWQEGEDREFVGGGWGGWSNGEGAEKEPMSIGIMIGVGRRKE